MKKIALALVLFMSGYVTKAQWLLNFGTATTVQPRNFVFISGTGAQFTRTKNPSTSNFTPFLAHAGLRTGLTSRMDIGYRLCNVPLPYNVAGPTLGSAMDVKFRVTPMVSTWQCSIILGGGYAYVQLFGNGKSAWSPGGAVVASRALSKGKVLAFQARALQTSIPTAVGGSAENYVNVFGGSAMLGFDLHPALALLVEAGVFDMQGRVNATTTNALGFQTGVVLKVDWKKLTTTKE